MWEEQYGSSHGRDVTSLDELVPMLGQALSQTVKDALSDPKLLAQFQRPPH